MREVRIKSVSSNMILRFIMAIIECQAYSVLYLSIYDDSTLEYRTVPGSFHLVSAFLYVLLSS